MATRKKVRIRFTVDGRNFEAVSFINKGESSVGGDEMLQRVPDAIGKKDGKFLERRVDQDWSRKLWPYYLVTNRRHSARSRSVRYFRWHDGEWSRYWSRLDVQWDGRVLVVRRCA